MWPLLVAGGKVMGRLRRLELRFGGALRQGEKGTYR